MSESLHDLIAAAVSALDEQHKRGISHAELHIRHNDADYVVSVKRTADEADADDAEAEACDDCDVLLAQERDCALDNLKCSINAIITDSDELRDEVLARVDDIVDRVIYNAAKIYELDKAGDEMSGAAYLAGYYLSQLLDSAIVLHSANALSYFNAHLIQTIVLNVLNGNQSTTDVKRSH